MLKNKKELKLKNMVHYLSNILLFLILHGKKFIYYYTLNHINEYNIKTNFGKVGDS